MEEYRLINVKRRNTYANSWCDSEPYIATYEVRKTRKKYFFFGETISKTYTEEAVFEVKDNQCSSWLKTMESKKGVWRRRS
jgi:hypothetical protein